MKTLIAVPCMDMLHTAFAESLLNMVKPEGTGVCFKSGSLVQDSRNLLSLYAINNGYDTVLWLDSDMVFPADTLVRMQARVSKGIDMVTGLYFKRTMPTSPVLYKELLPPEKNENGEIVKRVSDYTDYPHESMFTVAGCGFGCVMTTTALLKRMWDEYGPPFTPYFWCGEDIAFCHRVNQSNVPICCDSSITCGHIGLFSYTEQLFQRQSMTTEKTDERKTD